MFKSVLARLGLAALLALFPLAALGQGAGVGLTSTPPAGSVVLLETTSPTNVGITVENFASWVGSGGSQGNSVIGTGVNKVSIVGAATTVAPLITTGGSSSDANIGIIIAGKGTGLVHLGGTAIANGSVRIPTVASAVNAVTLSGAVTTAEPAITVGGSTSDANIGISISGKGTGNACLGGTTCANSSLTAVTTASAVTHVTATGGTTGVAPSLAALGETNLDLQLSPAGTGQVNLGNTTTCTGTTTATCNAQRFIVSITGLTTAAGASATAMVVTNNKVAATDIVHCQTNIYAGTGIPLATIITPGSGSVSITVLNVATSGSLNATVPIACVVF